jgi:hypothetical protein
MGGGHELEYSAQVLRDLSFVISLAQEVQFCDQLRHLLLMKNRDGFMTDETEVWEISVL